MDCNKEAESLAFRRGSEVSQALMVVFGVWGLLGPWELGFEESLRLGV